ncbi:MAG: ABC transporter permease [Gemmatimonas sp.]|uniref:ABC transporter permease n=1 Tax=Gemmatimonas sp. TaxID=1962908 RepID=UPI0025BBEC7D|nr:ABC transporter permease [Gemmatimonas sp.]MCA2985932.1 ABC transporter permease [Gemmatimonas sp.]
MTTTDSTIHDLGYRRYDGEREGARGAFRALFWQGFRAMFGLGRPMKTKAVPVFVSVVTMLPALASVAASGATQGQLPITYANVIGAQALLFLLFSAAQAPEMLCRDQQHRVLPLLFTRDVTRTHYALARLLALFTAMFLVALAPLLILYLGEIGVAKDPGATFAKMGNKLGPVLLFATLLAWVMSTVSAFLSSLTPRRAYATAAVIGGFLGTVVISQGLQDLAGMSEAATKMIDPIETLRTTAMQLFGETKRWMELTPPPPVWVHVTELAALGLVAAAALVWRVRRVSV